ncbi:MAG: ATP-binding protein [Methanosarcinales archaeon]|nr:ATP-binding protein [Methanosarcinales archaeon]
MLPVGSPAIGDDFIDRENEIKQISTALAKDNVLLIAPRRFGKTSIMKRLKRDLSSQDEISIFIEVEDVDSPPQFLTEIVMALFDNERIKKKTNLISTLGSSFQWLKDNIEEIGVSVFRAKLRSSIETDLKEDWTEKSRLIFDIIDNSESNIYFIIDEFPIAIKNMDPKDSEKFLHWFRKLRQVSENLRFIVGGSVSIDRVVRDVGGVAVINDFRRVRIGGFQREVALDAIKKVFREEKWQYTEVIGDKILDCIGEAYLPYFIAIMLSAIKEERVLTDEEINEKLIEDIYNFRILGNDGKHYFEHYSQRLRIFYTGIAGMEEKAARAILRRVSRGEHYPIDLAFEIFEQETGIADYERFMDLIADLENDFYIENNPLKGLTFYSKMLRDWWRLYHGGIE